MTTGSEEDRRQKLKEIRGHSVHLFLRERGPKYADGEQPLTADELKKEMREFMSQHPGTIVDHIELMFHAPEFGAGVVLTFFPPILNLLHQDAASCTDPAERYVYEELISSGQKGLETFVGSRKLQ